MTEPELPGVLGLPPLQPKSIKDVHMEMLIVQHKQMHKALSELFEEACQAGVPNHKIEAAESAFFKLLDFWYHTRRQQVKKDLP